MVIDGTLPPGPWALGDTPWPRSGGCLRNARRTALRGPREGSLEELFVLPGKPNPTRHRYARSGVATAEDGFRVTSRRRLFAFDPAGNLRWSTELLGGPASRYEGTPLLLAGNHTVVGLDHHLAFVGPEGELLARVRVDGGGLDDTGHSPNLTGDGRLVLTGPLREVAVLGADGVAHSLGKLGLDIAPPAVAPDGSLVLAGFAGAGLVRIDPNRGTVLADAHFGDADQMPSVGEDGTMVVGSSLGPARVVAADGSTVATVEAQIFGETRGGWLAMSYGALRHLDGAGELVWETPLGDGSEVGWHLRMVVDAEGYAHCALPKSIACVSPEGELVYEVPMRERPTDMAPLADGAMIVVTAARVLRLG